MLAVRTSMVMYIFYIFRQQSADRLRGSFYGIAKLSFIKAKIILKQTYVYFLVIEFIHHSIVFPHLHHIYIRVYVCNVCWSLVFLIQVMLQ